MNKSENIQKIVWNMSEKIQKKRPEKVQKKSENIQEIVRNNPKKLLIQINLTIS